MRQILGLDLGVGSIGWSLITVNDNETLGSIKDMGCRIVMTNKEATDFTQGKGVTACSVRTAKRSARRSLDRFQQRRNLLSSLLRQTEMMPDDHLLSQLSPLELWKLRSDAATAPLSLPEIGRVLLHINSRRGYRRLRGEQADEPNSKKASEYLQAIKDRYAELRLNNETIGEHFYKMIAKNVVTNPTTGTQFYNYRIRNKTFPRNAYLEEFNKVMECQKQFHPETLTDVFIEQLRHAIFYQRPLKSCKHLVSLCEFEKRSIIGANGKEYFTGPKVAPRTSPIAQMCKIWESINNITLTNNRNRIKRNKVRTPSLFGDDWRDEYEYPISKEQYRELYAFMSTHEKMKAADVLKILGLKKSDGFATPAQLRAGLQGNTTYTRLYKALEDYPDAEKLLIFNPTLEDSELVNSDTGEVLMQLSEDSIKEQPLYKLWHLIYSIKDDDELKNALRKQFNIYDEEVLDRLAMIDFVNDGYTNKSNKFMRKLIPQLISGLHYSDAVDYINICRGIDRNEKPQQLDKLELLKKNEMRQPIVEKVLNQMINVINSIVATYGKPDEIRVELARELKMSKDNRVAIQNVINSREKEAASIIEKIQAYGIRATKSRIQKYRMWQESGERCIYCGKVIGLTEFLNGIEAEREHILPQAVFFDDSFSNKVCSCRECNHKKGKLTAYDFMKSQGDDVLENYISRVDDLYRDKTISKTKHDRLLTAGDQIPTDFLNRDLSLTQYITKKATDILSRITPKVTTTTGSVTDFLRHQWGYDMILHNLNFERFDKCGQTEEIVIDNHGEKHTEKRIKGWGKRCDHRHHAIDALVVALTRQSHIQRLNNLNAERDEMSKEVTTLNRQWNAKKSLLEKWIAIQPHFDVDVASAAVDRIAISIKPGQRLSTTSKRYVQRGGKRKLVQKGIITPRGALWEETVYGKIRAVDGSEAIVVRYPVESLKCKDLYSVVDDNIRALLQQRAKQCDNDDKTFKQSFAKEPLYTDAAQSCQLRTVRCFTGLDASKLAVVAKSANNNIGFAKAGNNHHIALYTDTKGAIHEIVVPFWLAVERKKYGVSSIIVNPQEELDKIHQSDKDIPEAILNTLPNAEWQMMLTLQQNEMFIIGMSDEEFDSAMQNDNLAELTAHMYRVQKLTNGDYFFRRQTSTSSDTKKTEFENGNVFRIRSLNKIKDYNPIKVKINLIGKIEKV